MKQTTPSQQSYGYPQGTSSVFPSPIISKRSPNTKDVGHPLGQTWVHEGVSTYTLLSNNGGVADWVLVAPNSGGISSIIPNSGTTATASNITLVGTGGITTVGSGSNTVTISAPTAVQHLTGDTGTQTTSTSVAINGSNGIQTVSSGSNVTVSLMGNYTGATTTVDTSPSYVLTYDFTGTTGIAGLYFQCYVTALDRTTSVDVAGITLFGIVNYNGTNVNSISYNTIDSEITSGLTGITVTATTPYDKTFNIVVTGVGTDTVAWQASMNTVLIN